MEKPATCHLGLPPATRNGWLDRWQM